MQEEAGPPEDEGTVVRQSPSGGNAKRGSTVTIWVGIPEEEEPPPDEEADPGSGGTQPGE